MEAVKVQYTVKEEYIQTNKSNIQQVMNDLKGINNRISNAALFCWKMANRSSTLSCALMKTPKRL
jgi:hypothetical protein